MITGILYLVGFCASVLMFSVFAARENRIGMLCMAAFFIRIIVAIILDTGLKYSFVLDSLAYERDAWLLAQSWASAGREFYSLPDGFAGRNFYELVLAGIFYIFGNEPLTAVFINIIVSVATIGLIYHTHRLFFSNPESPEDSETSNLIGILLLAIYPSSLVWSATNIRDPLYFLFCVLLLYFFLQAFSPRSLWPSVPRVGAAAGAALCFWGVLSLRSYVGWLFIAGLSAGTVIALIATLVRPRRLIFGVLGSVLAAAFLWQLLSPDDAAGFLKDIEHTRTSFSNAGLDDYAQSSFALDYTFRSMMDLVAFLPIGLAYYFFAPFPWQIRSAVQAFSLIEVLAVYALLWPTWIGIRRAFSWSRFETTVLIVFIAFMSVAQAVMISNSGTIFRHRTLGFMLLMIFTGIGIHELWKKNRKAVLPA